MSRVGAYRRVCRNASRLCHAVGAAIAASLVCSAPHAARADYTDIFQPIEPCLARTETVEETMDILADYGWEPVPDRTELEPDVLNALTWTRAVRTVIPDGRKQFDALARNGITGGVSGFFSYIEQSVTDEAAKADSPFSSDRTFVRRDGGEIDVLLLSYRSKLETMRQVVCVAGFGTSSAQAIVEWVEAREGPLSASQQTQFSYQGNISTRNEVSGATKQFAVNPHAVSDVPTKYERTISGVVETDVHFRVQEN